MTRHKHEPLPIGQSNELLGLLRGKPTPFAEVHRLSRRSYRWRLFTSDRTGTATTEHAAMLAAAAAAGIWRG